MERQVTTMPGSGGALCTAQPATLRQLIETSGWVAELDADQREWAVSASRERTVEAGALVCREGVRADHWYGVIDGLVKMSSVSSAGRPTSFIGLSAGGWFGEGTLIKGERRRYDVVALRRTRIALVPADVFIELLDSSIAFNRFLLNQINERLAQFIGLLHVDRLGEPDVRVAHCIAGLFNPYFHPHAAPELHISQREIGELAGTSRQRAHQALHLLESRGLLKIGFETVTVLDLEGLRRFRP